MIITRFKPCKSFKFSTLNINLLTFACIASFHPALRIWLPRIYFQKLISSWLGFLKLSKQVRIEHCLLMFNLLFIIQTLDLV